MVYKTVVNINFHHAYFLDDGEKKFSGMTDRDKEDALKNYRLDDYLKIVPTHATQIALNNHRILFKPHAYGFRIIATVLEKRVASVTKYSPVIALDNNLTFTFGIYATNPYFYNYSQVINREDTRLYLFANKKPATEAVGFANIFTNDGTVDTSFLLKENSTRRLVHLMETEDEFLKSAIDRFSIANIPIADIDGTQGKALAYRYIQTKKNEGLIGVIRLTVKGDSGHNLLELDETDPSAVKQYILGTTPKFTLSFKNRKTFWKYINIPKNFTLTTEATKPLTKNGFVKIEASDFNPQPTENHNYPNPKPYLIKKEANKYYSEIFI